MKTTKKIKYFTRDLLRTAQIVWQADKTMSVITICLQFVQALLPVISLYFIKLLVEQMSAVPRASFDRVLMAIVAFCLVQFLQAAANQIMTYTNTLQQQKITDHVSELVLRKAVTVNMEYYENPEYHNNLHMAQFQSQFRVPQLVIILNALLLNSFSLLLLTSFFFTIHWLYACVLVILSIPMAAIKWYYSHQLYRLEKKLVPMEREATYFHMVLTSLNYAKEVRAFGFGSSFIAQFRQLRHGIYFGKKKLNSKLTGYSILMQVFEAIMMIFIFILLAKNAWAGGITLGVFVIYIQGFQRLQTASKNLLQSIVQLFQQRVFLKDLFLFLDIPVAVAPVDRLFPQRVEGVTVDNLSFVYPNTTKTVLNNISIKCDAGKIIAIVGENGSGKSTLVKLLARMYNATAGIIKINNNNVNDIATDSYLTNSIVLFQDFEKYFFTVAENITLAGESLQKGISIDRAAMMADADEFIDRLPEKYATRLGRSFDLGEQLSGGQWQKLALARMFYKNAQMVILDEPTSAIDAIAENRIFNNLKEYAKNKVVILISHTLYNLKIADYVYVMKDGCIAEEGNFDDLIAKDGIFKQMFDNQKI